MPSKFRDMWLSGKVSIDRKNRDQNEKQQEKAAAEVLRQFIPEPAQGVYSDLQRRRGQETGRWLKSLSTETPQDSATAEWQQAQNKAADAFEAIRVWIEALFQEFSVLAYGFNEHAVGSDLFVSIERAQVFETRDDSVWYRPVSKYYQGRLTTRYWSLTVKGDEKRIGVFLFPAEMTIGFKNGEYSDLDVPPLIVAEPCQIGGRNSFKIQGEEAAISMLGHLAKELFGDLIRVASGKMSETELFASHKDAPKLGENVAVGYDSNAQPARTQEHHPAHDIDLEQISLSDACDILDKVIDRELKRIYGEATKSLPGTEKAESARMQISSIEAFRMKVVDAFENYSHESHAIEAGEAVVAGKF